MANAVVPRWHGDNYQSRFFWLHAAALRDPQREDVVQVTFEADGPKAFDDVVVYYDPGRPSMSPQRITVDFHQIKWHADYSGHFGYRNLVDPAFINATTFSILERLAQAKAKPGVPATAAFSLVTTDTITNGDPLTELISPADNSVRLERLFSTCQSALNFDPLSASNIDPLGVAVSTCRPGAGPGCRGSASADGFALRL